MCYVFQKILDVHCMYLMADGLKVKDRESLAYDMYKGRRNQYLADLFARSEKIFSIFFCFIKKRVNFVMDKKYKTSISIVCYELHFPA